LPELVTGTIIGDKDSEAVGGIVDGERRQDCVLEDILRLLAAADDDVNHGHIVADQAQASPPGHPET
jgi:hypothetical protein